MTKFVKLTRGEKPHWVNFDHVCEIRLRSDGSSTLVFNTHEPRTLAVDEAPEEVAALASASGS